MKGLITAHAAKPMSRSQVSAAKDPLPSMEPHVLDSPHAQRNSGVFRARCVLVFVDGVYFAAVFFVALGRSGSAPSCCVGELLSF